MVVANDTTGWVKSLTQQCFVCEHHTLYITAEHTMDTFFIRRVSRHVIPLQSPPAAKEKRDRQSYQQLLNLNV
ncbi:hypothetical protein D3C72_1789690 [compost metagenome]